MSCTFIFCCLIKSNNKSSGPSYIGMFILYGVAILPSSLLLFSCSGRSLDRFFLFLLCALCVLRDLCVNSYSLLLCLRRRSTNLFPLLTPPEHCFAYALHRPLRDCSRFVRTGIQNLENALRVVLPFHATFANRRNPLDQIFRHGGFALDAADSRCRTPLAYPLQPARLFR